MDARTSNPGQANPEVVKKICQYKLATAVMTAIIAELPKCGGEHVCCWCGNVQEIPVGYAGMWVECDRCGGV